MKIPTNSMIISRNLLNQAVKQPVVDLKHAFRAVADTKTFNDFINQLNVSVSRRALALRDEEFRGLITEILGSKYYSYKYAASLTAFVAKSGFNAAGWKLLPSVKLSLPNSTHREASLTTWSLGKLRVSDREITKLILQSFIEDKRVKLTQADVSMYLWGLSRIETNFSQDDLSDLKKVIEKFVENEDKATSQGVIMQFSGILKLFPDDEDLLREFADRITFVCGPKHREPTQELISPLDEVKEAIPPKGIVALWVSLAEHYKYQKVMFPMSDSFRETLCEQTRTLGLSESFDDKLCGELAKAVSVMKFKDPRVLHQLIHYVSNRTLFIRKEAYLQIVVSFARLKITDPTAWRKLAGRFEKHAGGMSTDELRLIEKCFRLAGKMTDRLSGVFELFRSLREDRDQYGDC